MCSKMGRGGNAAAASANSGVGRDNYGNSSSTTQQQAVGSGASTRSSTAQVNGSAFTAIDQSNENVAVNFAPLW
ncbi:hypothetical protein ABT151_37620 [Streptomyces bluensis]